MRSDPDREAGGRQSITQRRRGRAAGVIVVEREDGISASANRRSVSLVPLSSAIVAVSYRLARRQVGIRVTDLGLSPEYAHTPLGRNCCQALCTRWRSQAIDAHRPSG